MKEGLSKCRVCGSIGVGLLFLLGHLESGRAAPRDVFVLVDVSGSVIARGDQQVVGEVQSLISDLVIGRFKLTDHPNWRYDSSLLTDPLRSIVEGKENAVPLTAPTRRVIILPFGDKRKPHPQVVSPPFNRLPGDFQDFIRDNYPRNYTDQKTYVTLAYATTAKVAKDEGIQLYYMFVVTDAFGDTESDYTEAEWGLKHRWDSKGFVEERNRIGVFNYQRSGLDSKNFQVDVWQVKLGPIEPGIRIVLQKPESGSSPVLNLTRGNTLLEWAVKKGSESPSQPSGLNFHVGIIDNRTGAVIDSTSVPGRYSKDLDFGGPGDYELTITGAPEKSGGEYPQNLGRFQARVLVELSPPIIVLSSPPELRAEGDPTLIELPAPELPLQWELVKEGKSTKPPGAKFKVELLGGGAAPPAAVTEVGGYETKLKIAKSGSYTLQISHFPAGDQEKALPFEKQIELKVPETAVVLTEPDLPADSVPGTPVMIEVTASQLSLQWALEKAGEKTTPEDEKFKVELLKQGAEEPVVEEIVNGCEKKLESLTIDNEGIYTLRITHLPANGGLQARPFEKSPVKFEPVKPILEFRTPARGFVSESGKVTFMWRIVPSGVRAAGYRLTISGPERKEVRVRPTTYVEEFKKGGSYRATVSVTSPNTLIVQTATTEFTVKKGFPWGKFLMIAVLIGALVFLLPKILNRFTKKKNRAQPEPD